MTRNRKASVPIATTIMTGSLPGALVAPLASLRDARDRTAGALDYLVGLTRNVTATRNRHVVWSTNIGGRSLFLRPVNTTLFIDDVRTYWQMFDDFETLLAEIRLTRAALADNRIQQVRDTSLVSPRALHNTAGDSLRYGLPAQPTGISEECWDAL